MNLLLEMFHRDLLKLYVHYLYGRDYKKHISTQSDAITMDIISGKVSDLELGSASAVSLYARYLKRIAAHSRNLISSVVNPFERIGYPE